jgi:hypothetical protein
VVLPLRIYKIDDVLKLVAWRQWRNHSAYLSHKKRRETEGSIKWRCSLSLRIVDIRPNNTYKVNYLYIADRVSMYTRMFYTERGLLL